MPQTSTTPKLRAATVEAETALAPSLRGNIGYITYRAFLQVQQIYVEALADRLHPRELTIVARLAAGGPCSQQELSDCLSVNRSMMVHVIDGLEGAGLVVRERNATDRRSYALVATGRAIELLAELAPTVRAADAEATRRLSERERRCVRTLLAQLLGASLPAVAPPVSQTTAYLIARAHFGAHARADELCAPLGLDIREYATLATIADLAPCSQQQVATMLGVSGPVIVELIDALEPRALVVRERSAADRRSYALRLTRQGSTLRERARASLSTVEREIGERIGEPEQLELGALLRRLVGAAEAG